MIISDKFHPGDRIMVLATRKATVISQTEFFSTKDPHAIWEYHEYEAMENMKNSAIVFLRWDMNEDYDWYWEWHCQLLPSSKLANGARSNV